MGVGIGSFAQGLAGGIGQGVQIATAIDRDKREQERFAFEKPRLEAEAAKAEQDLAFQKDFKEGMAALMQEAKGGEGVDENGVAFTKPALEPIEIQKRAAEIMKASMFRAGKLDFAQLKAANDYTKELESEGVLEALRYAMANPNDQEGIRKIFNSKGNIKLGDDVQIGIEDGMFGPNVVGYKIGADGKQVKAFDGTEILMPYLGAQTFAQLKQQQRITEVKEKGDTMRTGITAGANIEAQRMRNIASMAETQRRIEADEARERRAGAITPAKQYDALNTSFNTIFTGLTRNMLDPAKDGGKYADIYTTAKAMAVEAWRNPSSPTYGNPEASIQGATREVLKRNGMLPPANTR